MARNFTFSVLSLFLLMGSMTLFISCKSCHESFRRITIQDFQADSVVNELFGDTVCRILYMPKKVYAYKMCPPKTESGILIANNAIDYVIGELDASCSSILQFFLKDSYSYVWTDEIIKTPFSPNIGFEFIDEKHQKVYLLLSFNGNQLKIIMKDQVLLHRQFKNEYNILRFVQSLLSDNKYIENLFIDYKTK